MKKRISLPGLSGLTMLLLLQVFFTPPAAEAMGSLPSGPSEKNSDTELPGSHILVDAVPASVRLVTDREYLALLERYIGFARSEIVIVSYLFSAKERFDNEPRKMAEALAAAAARGVNVRVILEIGKESSNITQANREAARFLVKRGVKVFSDESGTVVHSKLAVIDNRLVFVGSHDLSSTSLGTFREATVVADSPSLALSVQGFIESLAPAPYREPPPTP